MTASLRVSRWADRCLVAVALASTLFLLLQLLDFGYGRDQGIYAAVARVIRGGGAPYRDAWDFKTPGIYFVYLVSDLFMPSGVIGIRMLETALLASMVLAFAILSQRYLGDWRAGVAGACLATLTHVQLEFWHTAQPESFGAGAVAWALVLTSSAATRPAAASWRHWFSGGLLYGAAGLLKPTIGIAALSSLALAVRRAWASAALLCAGAAVAVTTCLVVLHSRGATHDMVEALFVFAPHYTAVSWHGSGAAWLYVAKQVIWDWLFRFGLLNVVGIILLALTPHDRQLLSGISHVGGAVLLLLVGVGVQLKLFPYHFGAVLPLTALLAGWGYWKLWARVRVNVGGIAGFTLLVIVLLGARSATTQVPDSFAERCRLRVISWLDASHRTEIRDRLYTVVAYSARENRLLNEWIERTAASDDRIYIWGFVPETYIVTRRINPTRFVYNLPQRAPWTKAAAREELMKELREQPPRIIVVEHGDAMPHVTGTTSDSAAELGTFADLQSFVDRGYRLAYHTTKFDAYETVPTHSLPTSTQGPANEAGSAGIGVKLNGRSQGE